MHAPLLGMSCWFVKLGAKIMWNMNQSGLLLLALLLSSACYAGEIEVDSIWLRATAPGQTTAGVELSITSKRAAKLVGASSPAAQSVEIHAMSHDNGIMRMREVKAVELPAGKHVSMRASGYHLMLTGLKAPLKAGDRVLLTLNIKVAETPVVQVETSATVQPLTAQQPVESLHSH